MSLPTLLGTRALTEIINAFLVAYAALFPIVNPLGSALTFLGLTSHYSKEARDDVSLHIAVNQTIVSANHALTANDEIALLPPVCGGSEAPEPNVDLIDLVDTPLESHPWRKHLTGASGSFGAITSGGSRSG